MADERVRRRFEWQARATFPDNAAAPLAWGAERWRPAPKFPEYHAVMEAAASRGEPINATYELTRDLIDDVIAAAAAVEYTVERLDDAVATAQRTVDSWNLQWPDPEPEYGSSVTVDSLWTVYAEFNNLLTWLRALEERLDRQDPGLNGRSGLLPALSAGPLKDRVGELVAQLRRDLLEETRPLANYVLHASVVPSPMRATTRVRQGMLILDIPDRPKVNKVRTRLDLSYTEGRTVVTFAEDALGVVTAFVDRLLDAFEENTPGRLRQVADSPSIGR